jgi:hypothetical protein
MKTILPASVLPAAVLFLGVAACTSTTTGGSPQPAVSTAFTACSELQAASLARVQRCGGVTLFPLDEARREHEARRCASALAARGTRLEEDHLVACARALEAAACDDDELPSVCAARPGALVDGTACFSSSQCVSGHCAREPDEDCGRCARRPEVGERCDATWIGLSGQCGFGECSWAFGPTHELESRCVHLPGQDAPALAPGEPCELYGATPCEIGSACVEGVCEVMGTAAGERCDGFGHWDYIVATCDDGLACDAITRTCAEVELQTPGAPCDMEALRCDRGFCEYTAANEGTCVRLRQEGEACDDSDVRIRCAGLARCREGTCQIADAATCD